MCSLLISIFHMAPTKYKSIVCLNLTFDAAEQSYNNYLFEQQKYVKNCDVRAVVQSCNVSLPLSMFWYFYLHFAFSSRQIKRKLKEQSSFNCSHPWRSRASKKNTFQLLSSQFLYSVSDNYIFILVFVFVFMFIFIFVFVFVFVCVFDVKLSLQN